MRAAQLRTLTDFAVQMHVANDYSQLAQSTTAAIERLIPCEWAFVNFVPSHFPAARCVHGTHTRDWTEYFDHYYQHAHQDPVYLRRLRLLLDRPAHDLEFARASDLARTDLYAGLWRRLGCERMLSSLNPGPFSQSFMIARGPRTSFSRDEVLLFDLLTRHFVAATEHQLARNHGWLTIDKDRAHVERFAWLVADASGRILRFHPGAQQCFKLCVGPGAPLDRLPAQWLAELRRRWLGHPGTPFRYRVGRRSFSAHVAPIRESPGDCSVVFVEYPPANDPLRPLLALGLTPREAEVLRAMATGKSNAEIGASLGISRLTAKKHVENLLQKLGVTSRAAAVTKALTATHGDR